MSAKDIKLARKLLDIKLTEAKRLISEMPEEELPEKYWEKHSDDFENRESFLESAEKTYRFHWDFVRKEIEKEKKKAKIKRARKCNPVLTVYNTDGEFSSFEIEESTIGDLVAYGVFSEDKVKEKLGGQSARSLLDVVHEELDFAPKKFNDIVRSDNFLAVLVEPNKDI